jgi:hypothetical protein
MRRCPRGLIQLQGLSHHGQPFNFQLPSPCCTRLPCPTYLPPLKSAWDCCSTRRSWLKNLPLRIRVILSSMVNSVLSLCLSGFSGFPCVPVPAAGFAVLPQHRLASGPGFAILPPTIRDGTNH